MLNSTAIYQLRPSRGDEEASFKQFIFLCEQAERARDALESFDPGTCPSEPDGSIPSSDGKRYCAEFDKFYAAREEHSRAANAAKNILLSDVSRLDCEIAVQTDAFSGCQSLKEIQRGPIPLKDESRPEALRSYAVFEGMLWRSDRELEPSDWATLIENEARRERAVLTALKAPRTSSERISISIETRDEVWRRDLGRCTRCGGREHLEFDHIVPIAMGGSNTSRNIELLCESCNRRKGATLG